MHSKNPQLVKASVALVIIAGALGALSIMVEGIGVVSGKIFLICLSLIIFGITAMISLVVTRKPAYKTLGMAGAIASGLGFLLVFVVILAEVGDEGIFKLGFVLFILSIALAHISLLHYFNLQNKYAMYARMTATVAISLFSIFIIMRIFEPFAGISSLLYSQSTLKMLVASFIIDLAATLLVPLCNRLKVEKPVEFSFKVEAKMREEHREPE